MFDGIPMFLAQAAPAAGGGAAPVQNGLASAAPGAPDAGAVPGAAPGAAPGAGAGQAVEGQPANSTPVDPTAAQRPSNSLMNLMPIILIFVVLWFILFMPQRKEKKRRKEMLAVLKKGDRVQTVGGMMGTIVEVRPTEVVVKVDESTNTRIRFSTSAIQNVMSDADEPTYSK